MILISAASAAKKTTIGGQALIEGLLMIGPKKRAMAVRKSSGEIQLVNLAPIKITKASNWLFIRGSVRLFRQLVSGTKALMRSAELAEEAATHGSADSETSAGEETTCRSVEEAATHGSADSEPSAGEETTRRSVEEAATHGSADSEPSAGEEKTRRSVEEATTHGSADSEPSAGEKTTRRSVEEATTQGSADSEPSAGEAHQSHQKQQSFFGKISSVIDNWLEKHAEAAMYITAVLGILFSVVLFILLPNFLASFVRQLTVLNTMTGRGATIFLNLIEGVIRISVFVLYLALTSRLKDIRRVWMYHGAEHKTIACYEDGNELSVEHVRGYSRFHPRCGTAFLFIVILVSIVVFSFVGWWNRWLNLLIRFALVPLVAGIAYEIIRLAGRYDNKLTRFMSAPGLWLQRFTTAEPDDGMLEVAIAAMNAVKPDSDESDKW